LISLNTFKTKDKEPVCFQIFKTNQGTSFIVRDYRIIFRINSSQSINKDDLKRIKKAVREFMKKYTLYIFRNWKAFMREEISPKESLFELFGLKKADT
ncbi:unnamed protein product, partial [marine sediment metagenome]